MARIGWLLGNFSDDYGEVSGRSGFLLERNPDTVRCPDLAWVAPGGLARPVVGCTELAPDLVVEVKSFNDSQRHMAERATMWLPHGVPMALAAGPVPVTLTVYLPASCRRFSTCSTGATCCPASPHRSGASFVDGHKGTGSEGLSP